MAETRRQKNEILRTQLENERSTFISHWRDLGDYILPRRPRFFLTDVNKGDRRNQRIIDSTATLAARTLRAGMMGGVTSPARPWFRLTTPDPGMADISSVKQYLYIVGQRMTTVFLRSNLYQVLPIVYGDLGVFATGAMLIEEDLENVIRCTALPVGSYSIANDENLKVGVFFREFRMTVRQIVQRFGYDPTTGKIDWSNISGFVQNQWEKCQYETWVDVCHVIKPNENYNPKKLQSKFKRYSSCYYEKGTSGASGVNYISADIDGDKLLSERGYDFFPVLCPRWEVTGEDVYGTECPGMTALGDIKQLQLGEKRGAQAIEKMINPPMTGPAELRNQKASILPGDITYVNVREGQQGFKPAHEINFRIDALENKQQQIRERIRKAFYEDLFLMLANDDRSGITATEVAERKEEKLLALGPVLEQLNQDLLDRLIDITFYFMGKAGLLPPPPKEIQGMPLRIEYISVMAQAQKLVGIASVERFANFAAQVAQVKPEALDKIDADQMLEIYGDMTSVPPGIILSDDQVQSIRDQKAKAQQAQAQMQQIQQGAMAAKNLSQTDTSGNNALTQLMQQSQAGSLT